MFAWQRKQNKQIYMQTQSFDPEYIPGNLTPFRNQHPSRDFLLEDKYKHNKNTEHDSILGKDNLADNECSYKECNQPPIKFIPPILQATALKTSRFSPKFLDLDLSNKHEIDINEDYLNSRDITKMLGSHTITEKPNERCPSPITLAYANFELAKQMHSNNLGHQPLPDCVADLAYRKLQITGKHPGLALEIEPIATGVGIKTHNAGPTHCTKMKVFRPKTTGVIPRELGNNCTRSYSARPIDKKMGAMDLAICWDYKPSFEPPKPAHIDGSKDSAGPSVFTYIKTPSDDAIINTGKSSGIFANTLEDDSFFDKDILKRNTDFVGKSDTTKECLTRAQGICRRVQETPLLKHFKSTPDIFADQEYKTLRAKYLEADWACPEMSAETGCKRLSFINKARSKLCHKIAPDINCCSCAYQPKRTISKTVFRAGLPRTDAVGNYICSDNGYSIGSNHSQRILVIPRPRSPHRKKSYDINTLVPPFQCYAGGAGEGGYPEHWRLSSVYQHAFKPLEGRKKSLLQTVYK